MFTGTVPVLDSQHDAVSMDYPALSGSEEEAYWLRQCSARAAQDI